MDSRTIGTEELLPLLSEKEEEQVRPFEKQLHWSFLMLAGLYAMAQIEKSEAAAAIPYLNIGLYFY